jgi:hypothetical protein
MTTIQVAVVRPRQRVDKSTVWLPVRRYKEAEGLHNRWKT